MYFSYLRDEQFRLRKSKWMTIRLMLFGGLLHLSFSLVAQVKNIELEKTVVRNIVAEGVELVITVFIGIVYDKMI